MFTHICISAENLEESKKFYDATLAPLGIQSVGQINDRTCVYATETGKLLVMKPYDAGVASFANGGTVSFEAASKEAVDSFHAAGLANGGRDEGVPGPRPNAPGNAYGAYLRDPVGNKICAFAQLPE